MIYRQELPRLHRGFTLTELLIAVAIVGILAAVALPAYQEQARKAGRADGQNILLELQGAMERHFFDNNTYPNGLSALAGYANNTVDSAEGRYQVAMNIDADCPITNCYELVATAQGGQVADGNLELHSNGTKVGNW